MIGVSFSSLQIFKIYPGFEDQFLERLEIPIAMEIFYRAWLIYRVRRQRSKLSSATAINPDLENSDLPSHGAGM